MAQRRMFSLDITDSDAFQDMPGSAQLLYFHFGMKADDDGFVSSPKRIMKVLGVNEDDFKILVAKRFILTFESGVIVIKHWKINNYIQKDRYHETKYLKERRRLFIKENGSYTDKSQNGYSLDTEVRARLGKATNKDLKNPINKDNVEAIKKVRETLKGKIKGIN